MAEHQRLAANLQLKVFFRHAHSPLGGATCESQNDRIRHYLPKGTDLSLVSYQQLRDDDVPSETSCDAICDYDF